MHNSPIFIDIGQGLSVMAGMPTITYWAAHSRPKNPRKGTFGFNSDTNSLECWSGSIWLTASLKTLAD